MYAALLVVVELVVLVVLVDVAVVVAVELVDVAFVVDVVVAVELVDVAFVVVEFEKPSMETTMSNKHPERDIIIMSEQVKAIL
jgi:hypothetical protein